MTPLSADPTPPAWPYPRWIAHRGAGKLAPENTLAAFRLGASYGYRMFECDVKLSQDGVPFLMHDATLTRTTNASQTWNAGQSMVGGEHPWAALSQLDAGSWHSRGYAGEPLATLASIARYLQANGFFVNLEIKPTPGQEHKTGTAVAHTVARLWANETIKPLLSSFEVEALRAALDAEPTLPRALLLDTLWTGWLETARELGCHAIVCNYALWDANTVALAQAAGFRTASYTVNDEWAGQYLIDLGTDSIITDRVDRFSPLSGPV